MSLDLSVRSESFNENVRALRQDAVNESFFANGDGPWTVIYDEWSIKGEANGGQFIALSQLNMRERVIRDVDWDVRNGEGIPGFVDDGTEVRYFKSWPGLVLWTGCFEGCWLLLVVLCPLARVLVG